MRSAAAVMLAMLLGTSAWAGENLIQNGGFEKLVEHVLPFDGWTGWNQGKNVPLVAGDVVADKTVKHGGTASASLVSTTPRWLWIGQKVKTGPGWYKLTMYVRAENLTENAGRAARFGFDTKGWASLDDVLPPGTYGWRKVERIYHLPETPADYYMLYIFTYGSGKLNVDDVTLEKVDGTGLKEGISIETLPGTAGSAVRPLGFEEHDQSTCLPLTGSLLRLRGQA